MSTLGKLTFRLDRGKINSHVGSAAKRGTHAALDHLASVSKQQVPLDTGALMRSCAVDVASDGLSGTVSYDTPYAVKQHEVTTYNHQRGRKAKYLEDPINDKTVQEDMMKLLQSESESSF